MPAGRPSSYTPEIAEEICDRIASGETLTALCREQSMPALRTVMGWLDKPEFAPRYARAKYLRLEVMAEEIKQLADECREGVKTKVADGITETWTGDMVERSKLQIESRKWLLARLAATTYGDGVGQLAPSQTGNTVQLIIMPSGTSPAEVDRTIDVSAPRLHGIVSESGAE